MSQNRLTVFPSRMVLTGLKERTAAAKTGHSLLKRKSDAIKANLNLILKEILEVKKKLFSLLLKEAAKSHTDAAYYGEFNAQVIEHTTLARFKIRANIRNVAGVRLPVFLRYDDESAGSGDSLIGLSGGGQQILKCKEMFTKALLDLIRLASLQTSLKTLDDALKVTNRRVNALEFVVIPVLDNTMVYVLAELDELEREDQYRIKKVKDLRTREAEELEIVVKAENLRRIRFGLAPIDHSSQPPAQSLVDDKKEENNPNDNIVDQLDI